MIQTCRQWSDTFYLAFTQDGNLFVRDKTTLMEFGGEIFSWQPRGRQEIFRHYVFSVCDIRCVCMCVCLSVCHTLPSDVCLSVRVVHTVKYLQIYLSWCIHTLNGLLPWGEGRGYTSPWWWDIRSLIYMMRLIGSNDGTFRNKGRLMPPLPPVGTQSIRLPFGISSHKKSGF